jgi:hypothetical protein
LVCHSLGGLVAKRAFILARQLSEYDEFSRRVRAIFFLATPHRGSNLAKVLKRILQVTLGARPFVSDLIPNSSAIQSVNDEFPHHCQDLQLHSFYETIATNCGVKKAIVVPKDSATLGYANERTMYLDANHREICKFSTREDPNYLAVRNSLASALDDLRISTAIQRRETDCALQQQLKDVLDIDDAPDDDLLRIDSLRMPGTCAWITEERTYQEWRESLDPQLYWISANPGTGKSVLSGFVIKSLKDLDENCVFYFFSSGDKWKSSIGFFLRSIAWQMSLMHIEVFNFLLKTCRKDPQLSKANYLTIWRKLFLEGIFQIELSRPQFWIIDGLDECKNDSELVPLLTKAAEVRTMRIFITSRSLFDTFGSPPSRELRIISKTMPPNSTKADIRLYLEENFNNLPALGPDRNEARESTMALILEKSSGCFLWVRIVLQELRRVHTAGEVREVLESVPSDMGELYMRILDSMSRMPYGKKLAKAILTWTVCASRPLTTDELYHALQIDINDSIDDVERSIASTCGQLVYVDANARVRMVHQTARDFLLRPNNRSEFAVDKRAGHTTLVMVCLKYLSGREMTGQKHRQLSSSMIAKERCPFVSYACNSLAPHIAFVSSEDDIFVSALSRFLSSSNVLSWIEYIAQNSDLSRLIQTGRSFRHYLQRRSRHTGPLGRDVALIDSWAVDLVRLVTKFGRNLSSSPASIFHFIPPFCPADAALRKQFANSARSITVSGLSATTWDDCSSTITYQQDTPFALACSSRFFGVGLLSGIITIYDETTCQDIYTLVHGEAVKTLQFGENEDILASVALKSICVWNIHTREQLWKFDLQSQCMALSFLDNDRLLLAIMKSNQLLVWDMTTGLSRVLTSWLDELDDEYSGFHRRAVSATLAGGANLLAVVYRGLDIILWDIGNEMIYDIYGKDTGSLGPQARRRPGIASVLSLMFSRATETCLLAAAFNDGELVVFNTVDGLVQATAPANAHTMASSADGLMLACGNSTGTIQVFEFDTLKLLYRIQSEEYGIKSLAFSGDSHRLIDVRGLHCRVWDPSVLVREDHDEENSHTVSVSTAPQDIKLDDSKLFAHITAFACAEGTDAVFCGKLDGSVCLYETKNGQQVRVLFRHTKGVSIVSLFFDAQSGILSSVDSSSRTVAHKLVCDRNGWSASKTLLDHRVGVAVDQILGNVGCTLMLITSVETDTLWSIDPDGSKKLTTITWEKRRRYRWSIHPTDIKMLFLITDNVAHLYEWQSLTRLTTEKGIQLLGSESPELAVRSITPCFDSKVIAISFAESLAPRSKSRLGLWNLDDFTAEAESAVAMPHHQFIADQVKYVMGIYDHRLVFLHQDGWVCSADSESFDPKYCNRHFFFPSDWLSTTGGMMLEIFRNGNIVFVQRDEVAIVKRGMEHLERNKSRGPGKRRSLMRGTLSDSVVERISSMSTP